MRKLAVSEREYEISVQELVKQRYLSANQQSRLPNVNIEVKNKAINPLEEMKNGN